MDIWKLKEKDLRNCSLQETIDIVDELGRIVTEQHGALLTNPNDMVNVTEMSDELYSIVSIIQNKILENAFNETLPRNWRSKKETLLTKLFSIMIVVQNIRDSARVWLSIDESNKHFTKLENAYSKLTEDYDKKKENLESQITNIQETTSEELGKQTKSIAETAAKTLKEIQGAEGKIVSHVLTLMGVFSAVITIILSIVVTSSSWLNNATASSAIVAFTIPNMVALFAVVSIVLLIYMYHNAFYPPLLENRSSKKVPTVISSVLLVSILFITALISVLAYRYADIDSEPHVRYVIDSDAYSIVDVKDKKTGKVHKCFEFELNKENYQLEYDTKYIHGSDIYYCSEHRTLE